MELPARMAEATAGAVLATQPVLADGRVRFQGEPVVAIAAETPEIAARAAELVEVEYGEFRRLTTRSRRSPRTHRRCTTAATSYRRWHLRSGDVVEEVPACRRRRRAHLPPPFVDHVYLETETGIGWIDAEGVLTMRVSTQVLEHYRDVAEILQLPARARAARGARTSAAASAVRRT